MGYMALNGGSDSSMGCMLLRAGLGGSQWDRGRLQRGLVALSMGYMALIHSQWDTGNFGQTLVGLSVGYRALRA